MPNQVDPPRAARVLRISGYTAGIASLLALILGLFLLETGARDLRATVSVSGDAIAAIEDTVAVAADATSEIREGVDAASAGVAGVSATALIGASSIEDVAGFIENDLPADLEAVQSSLPAAIQAAGAIDGTLRALSLFGVDYDPDQPFDESLRAVQAALEDMPEDLRSQGQALRDLVPAAADLAAEADRLSIALTQLGEDLEGIQGITTAYSDTLEEASATVERTEAAFDRNMWLLRFALVALSIAGMAVGIALVILSRFIVDATPTRTEALPARVGA